MKHVVTILVAALVVGTSVAGCATSTNDAGSSGQEGDASAGDATADTGSDAQGIPRKDAGVTPDDSGQQDGAGVAAGDQACGALTTKTACEQCCINGHPAGYKVYGQAIAACACQGQAVCATPCASEACANKPTSPGDACTSCMSQAIAPTGACYQSLSAACQSDTDCATLFTGCIPPCEGKP
jgi:hypothetical protein